MHTDEQTFMFNAFMPVDVKKSVDTDSETYTIAGWASTGQLDLQNEIIDPKGIDITHFREHGYINYEHKSNIRIGYPTENCYVDVNKGLYVEAKLFKNNPYATEMIQLAETLEKSGSNRKIGFSIEGAITKRNINDTRVIEGVKITDIAVTATPANPSATIETILKSFLTGNGVSPDTQVDAGALRREELASSITKLTYTLGIKDPKEYKDVWDGVVEYLTKSERMGYEESIITLQLAKGLSRRDAELAVLDIRKENLNNE